MDPVDPPHRNNPLQILETKPIFASARLISYRMIRGAMTTGPRRLRSTTTIYRS
ncbi:hypothetical protein RSAG8_07062, partial [Rhizoctonia solani AG-8 WAC10335]